MPCGRTCRNATIAMNTAALAMLVLVLYSMNELAIPSASAAKIAPRSWPRPPTMTTRNASIR